MSRKEALHKNLNLNIRGLGKSATIEINERSSTLVGKGKDVYKLGLGQSPFPVPQPVVSALQLNAPQKDYLKTQGLGELRKVIAQRYNYHYGLNVNASNVMIGPGSKELMFILQLTYYGDLVVPTPAWVSYEPQAKIVGRKVNFMHTTRASGWKITPEHIREICREDRDRPRILILNYPGNPSGTTYSHDELKHIAAEAKKYEVVLLSDEIYARLNFTGDHVSIAKYYPEGTIVSTGLSKWCGAGGWRLGCFVFPNSLRWLLEAMVVVASETFTATSAPIQYAAVTAFQGGYEIEQYLAHARRILAALGKKCAALLREAGAEVVEPEGAFYLFPDFSLLREKFAKKGIETSTELCRKCLDETGVAILPGKDFGRPDNELTVRLAYVHFDGSRALSASQSYPLHEPIGDSFLDQHTRPALTGVERLANWIADIAR